MSTFAAWVAFLRQVGCTGFVFRIGTLQPVQEHSQCPEVSVEAVVPPFGSIRGSRSVIVVVRLQLWRKVAVHPRYCEVFGQLLEFGICRR